MIIYHTILNNERVCIPTEDELKQSLDDASMVVMVDSVESTHSNSNNDKMSYQLIHHPTMSFPEHETKQELFTVARRVQVRLEASASDSSFGLRDLDERLLQDWLAALFHVSHFTGTKTISNKINCAEGLRLWMKLSEHTRSYCQLAMYTYRLSFDHPSRQASHQHNESQLKGGWKDMDDLLSQLLDANDLDQKAAVLDRYLIDLCDDTVHVLTRWVTKQSAALLKQFIVQYGQDEISIHAQALDKKTTATFTIKPGFESDRDDCRTEISSVAGTMLCMQYERLLLQQRLSDLMKTFVRKLPPARQKYPSNNHDQANDFIEAYALWQEVDYHPVSDLLKQVYAETLTAALESTNTQTERLKQAGQIAEVRKALLEDDDEEDDDNIHEKMDGSKDAEYVDADLQRAADDEHLVPATVLTLPSHALQQGLDILRQHSDRITITENVNRSGWIGNIGLLLVHTYDSDKHVDDSNVMKMVHSRSDEVVWLGSNPARSGLLTSLFNAEDDGEGLISPSGRAIKPHQRTIPHRLKPRNRYLLHFDLTDDAVESMNKGILTVSGCQTTPLELSTVLERLDHINDNDPALSSSLLIKKTAEHVVIVESLTASRLEQHEEDHHMMLHEVTILPQGYYGQSRYDGQEVVMQSSISASGFEQRQRLAQDIHSPDSMPRQSFMSWKLIVVHASSSFILDDGNEVHEGLSLLHTIPLHQLSSSIHAHHHPLPVEQAQNLAFYSCFDLSFLERGLYNITTRSPLTLTEIASELQEEKEKKVVKDTVQWIEQQWAVYRWHAIAWAAAMFILLLSALVTNCSIAANINSRREITNATRSSDFTTLQVITPSDSVLLVSETMSHEENNGDHLLHAVVGIESTRIQPQSQSSTEAATWFTSLTSQFTNVEVDTPVMPELISIDNVEEALVDDLVIEEVEGPTTTVIIEQQPKPLAVVQAMQQMKATMSSAIHVVSSAINAVADAISSALGNMASSFLSLFGRREATSKEVVVPIVIATP